MTYRVDWIIAADIAGKKRVTGSAEFATQQHAQLKRDAVKSLYPSAVFNGPYKVVYATPEEKAAS